MTTQTDTQAIMASAAHLVAALLDPREGVDLAGASLEVQHSVQMLRGQLDALGMLEPYRRDGGGLGVW